ncbi:MAG: hypothetical protein LBI56_00670 [Puniceicoccales bacterium]|jgi:hypothetical protein|nr:hypothetical protein [Puniceicoccales bacterium]
MKILRFVRPLFVLALFLMIGASDVHGKSRFPGKQTPIEQQIESSEKSPVFTDDELRDLLSDGSRIDQDMSGIGNNCAYYAVLSQINPKNFGGTALSPAGHAHGDASSYVQILRQKTKTPVGMMFDTSNIQKVSDYCKQPLIVICQEFMQIECVFPDESIEFAISPLDFDRNFCEWLEEYLANNSGNISRVLNLLPRLLPVHIDIREETVRGVIVGLLKNPKVIGLLHVNGAHFRALQPTRVLPN